MTHWLTGRAPNFQRVNSEEKEMRVDLKEEGLLPEGAALKAGKFFPLMKVRVTPKRLLPSMHNKTHF